MNRLIKDLGASVLGRLKNRAVELDRPYNSILQFYANERFLYRLSRSEHSQKFVLKGGLIFYGWNVPLRRHTKDIDFSAFTSNSIEEIIQIIKDVCNQPVEPDAMEFNPDSVTAKNIIVGAKYPGVRVRLGARIGQTARVGVQVDISFSDVITPTVSVVSYPTLLSMPAPQLKGYPKETVVAEKLHSIIHRGSTHSRIKDFYDLWFISEKLDFDGNVLMSAIALTFENRDTQIPTELPAALSDSYVEERTQQWQALKRIMVTENNVDVVDFRMAISRIREFLLPVMKAANEGVSFNLHWRAGRQWE